MALLDTAQFTLTGMTKKRSLGDRLGAVINVKEMGAIGDGAANDTAAIQAAFDLAYGAYADPHGSIKFGNPALGGVEGYTNRTVVFPAGNYKVNQTLCLNLAYGAVILGAGSYNTRIFFDPGADEHIPTETADVPDADTNISSLLECRMCWLIHMEGITLDASGIQQTAMRALAFPPYGPVDDGSGGYYRDVHLTGAVYNGFLSYGIAMGSERLWINCRFTNNYVGHALKQANALNHSFYNCLFADNAAVGLYQTTGGSCTIAFCRFENNGIFDIAHQQNGIRVVGCHSTSKNFCTADGTISGCTHVNAAEGIFWNHTYLEDGNEWTGTIPLTGAEAIYIASSAAYMTAKANYSSNGILIYGGGGSAMHLVGNTFDNTDYLDNVAGPNQFEDGAAIP